MDYETARKAIDNTAKTGVMAVWHSPDGKQLCAMTNIGPMMLRGPDCIAQFSWDIENLTMPEEHPKFEELDHWYLTCEDIVECVLMSALAMKMKDGGKIEDPEKTVTTMCEQIGEQLKKAHDNLCGAFDAVFDDPGSVPSN